VGIPLIQAADIGKVDEKISLGKKCDLCAEHVVVAEPYLLDSHGIVFIYYGYYVAVQETEESVAQIEISFFAAQIVPGEKNLPDQNTGCGKTLFIPLHEAMLSDTCARLLHGNGCGPFFKVERLHAMGNGARRDNDYTCFRCVQ